MARDKVHRNVVALCTIPTGTGGRPSKALDYDQASILIGARTEKLRALTWDNVDLNGAWTLRSRFRGRSSLSAPSDPTRDALPVA
jgi:hypothetical protein